MVLLKEKKKKPYIIWIKNMQEENDSIMRIYYLVKEYVRRE